MSNLHAVTRKQIQTTAVDSPLLHRKLQAMLILKKGLEEDMNEAYEAQNEHQYRECRQA
jgi:hypothetical protein